MSVEERLKALLQVFQGRLDQDTTELADDFAEHNEFRLALEIIIDDLEENATPISRSEYVELLNFGGVLRSNLGDGRFVYLEKLISKTGRAHD